MKQKKTTVYRSKCRDDWEKAQALLQEAGITAFPFSTEEVTGTGCGAKIDPRRFLNRTPVPNVLYQIDVYAGDEARASAVLAGRVRPVLSYGYSI